MRWVRCWRKRARQRRQWQRCSEPSHSPPTPASKSICAQRFCRCVRGVWSLRTTNIGDRVSTGASLFCLTSKALTRPGLLILLHLLHFACLHETLACDCSLFYTAKRKACNEHTHFQGSIIG